MSWRRLGHIFVGNKQFPWMQSHAVYPTVEHLEGDIFHIYFSSYDGQKRSSINYIDIDINQPQKILHLSSAPIIAPGPRGAFDDSGAVPSSFLCINGDGYLYYMGWALGVTVFARNSIGLAVRRKGQDSFQKYSSAPVVDRNEADPFTLTYSWVLPRPGGGYRMWYCSNLTWGESDDQMQHVIKYAESDDAIHWRRDGHVAVGLQYEGEVAISRPTVVADPDCYKMWYCWRRDVYRLGYATSENGRDWQRRDHEAGLEPDPGGWEQGSIHYPCVFDHKGQRFMLYNGGRYGSGGFGLAVWEK